MISPLLLSFTIVLSLYLILGKSFSPYLKAVSLLMADTQESAAGQEYENIFQGYEKKEEPEETADGKVTIDGNDITYPKRGALYARIALPSAGIEADIYFDDFDDALNRAGEYGARLGIQPEYLKQFLNAILNRFFDGVLTMGIFLCIAGLLFGATALFLTLKKTKVFNKTPYHTRKDFAP